jgi:ATP-dependent Clp protease ATP-binding subunit ClpA
MVAETRAMPVPGSGELICGLAERASSAASPGEALRLMRELRAAIDAFERRQVARALTTGQSVAEVSRALGVTRQSAHRRFRGLIAPGTHDGRPRPTPELRLVVEYARVEAQDLDAAAVGSEHLLLGSLRCGEHPAVAALDRLGVGYGPARDAARTVLAGSGTDVKRVLCAALQLAQRDGCLQIGIEHVLLGALHDPASGATATLRALRVPSGEAIAALAGAATR